jgi:hypothetical protein
MRGHAILPGAVKRPLLASYRSEPFPTPMQPRGQRYTTREEARAQQSDRLFDTRCVAPVEQASLTAEAGRQLLSIHQFKREGRGNERKEQTGIGSG